MKKFLVAFVAVLLLMVVSPVVLADELDNAKKISFNTYEYGNFSGNHRDDYYRFVLSEAGTIKLSFFSSDSQDYMHYDIYDENKNQIVQYACLKHYWSMYERRKVDLEAGEYYIRLHYAAAPPREFEYRFTIYTDDLAPSDSKPAIKSKVTTSMSPSTVYLKEGETFNFSDTVDTTSSKGLDDIEIELTKADNPGYGIKFFRVENVGSKSYKLSNVKGNLASKNYITAGDTISGYDEGGNYVSCKLEPGTSWHIRIFATDNEGSYMEGKWFERKIVIQEAEKSTLSVSKSSLSFDYKGTSQSLKITSNGYYGISTSANWISVSSLSGSGNKTINISCKENTSSSSRNGYVTIATDDHGSYCYVQITQNGKSNTGSSDGGCKHYWKIKESSYTKYEIISGNDSYHYAVPYYNNLCDECYLVMEENVRGTSTTEAHTFSGNKCSKCGYTKESKDTTNPVISGIEPYPYQTQTKFTKENVKFMVGFTDETKLQEASMYLDGTKWLIGNYFSGTSGNLSAYVDMSKLSAGHHYIKVEVKDAAQNVATRTYTFIVGSGSAKDTTNPVISGIEPYPYQTQTKFTKENVKFMVGFTDETKLQEASMYLDGTKWLIGNYFSGTSGNFSAYVDMSKLSAGTHYIKVEVKDAAKNVSTKTYTFTVSSSEYSWASAYQIKYLDLINLYRKQNGVAPVKLDAVSTLVANDIVVSAINTGNALWPDEVDANLKKRGINRDWWHWYGCDFNKQHGDPQNSFMELYDSDWLNSRYNKVGISLVYNSKGTPSVCVFFLDDIN